ncbi:DUF4176 domain-containing protein [Catenisphaera adipataccumulans]|jgi:hypothetical protein|uniref:DUF4176 domain-containing protein n=1 Tax=Catenisphaera adipataccumulans TaxID=700500 RepID=A0A7W8CXS9_9FIRM|nr:DUF4176 domain-containing protein [Catenisphaera adipataccumulans]MBB5183585.1 hypothetical protein [Catenisphaera adipataccumulans]
MKDLMPLGTVVTLHKGRKRLMIIGRIQNKVGEKAIYDYAGCLWPEGLIDSSHFYLFNQEDIEYLYYIGLQDAEEFNYRFDLEEQYEALKK